MEMSGRSATKAMDTNHEFACRELCDNVIATLPRELRDMIYEYVLSSVVRDVAALPTSEPTSSKSGPRYWQAENVGDATSKEILEVWYRLVRFHFGQDLGYLERFLSSQPAPLDTTRQLLVTKISIAFDLRDVGTHMQPSGGGVVRDSASRTRMLERLEHLFLLKEGASIHVYVIVPHNYTTLARTPDRYAYQERKVLPAGYGLSTGIMLSSTWPNNGSLYDSVSEKSTNDTRGCFYTGHGSNLETHTTYYFALPMSRSNWDGICAPRMRVTVPRRYLDTRAAA
ncbi:hypothetical protein J4E89_006099 [Alternaria sp. Ai002NY15]|nr:hypothetical protein J4E89_006099 [Alternaria sp. Ai002NY15]